MASSILTDHADATKGFDALFANELDTAKSIFRAKSTSSFHQIGLGSVIFLQAALGMEQGVMDEAVKALAEAESSTRAQAKRASTTKSNGGVSTRFPPGTEWEILHADAVVLHGMTHSLSETYYGYLQSIYALNSAHSKFTKLHKLVFPRGIEAYKTQDKSALSSPDSSSPPTEKSSETNTPSSVSINSSTSTTTPSKPRLLGRLLGLKSASSSTTLVTPEEAPLNGPIEEMIVAGAAFGYGLFNLVLSFLPAKLRTVIGFFGFKADRAASLRALTLASTISTDPHSVFAGLVLLSYHSITLELLCWQADEQRIIQEFVTVIDKMEQRYPKGVLWILNRAKLYRITNKPEEAITTLQAALAPVTPGTASNRFIQADALLMFELAWALLAMARYKEAAEAFAKTSSLNSWSHPTYLMLVVGCYLYLDRLDDAQKVLDTIPTFLAKERARNGDMPTEVYVEQRLASWKAKLARTDSKEKRLVDVIKINPCDELSIIWNNYHKMPEDIARREINRLANLTPHPTITTPCFTLNEWDPLKGTVDLDEPEELMARSLLLGILHRTIGEYEGSHSFLTETLASRDKLSSSNWIVSSTLFELATLDLVQAEARWPTRRGATETKEQPPIDTKVKEEWKKVLATATSRLDEASRLVSDSSSSLANRIETGASMLRDEMGYKKAELGI